MCLVVELRDLSFPLFLENPIIQHWQKDAVTGLNHTREWMICSQSQETRGTKGVILYLSRRDISLVLLLCEGIFLMEKEEVWKISMWYPIWRKKRRDPTRCSITDEKDCELSNWDAADHFDAGGEDEWKFSAKGATRKTAREESLPLFDVCRLLLCTYIPSFLLFLTPYFSSSIVYQKKVRMMEKKKRHAVKINMRDGIVE